MLTVKYQQVVLPSLWQKIPHANLWSNCQKLPIPTSCCNPLCFQCRQGSKVSQNPFAREAHLFCLRVNSSQKATTGWSSKISSILLAFFFSICCCTSCRFHEATVPLWGIPSPATQADNLQDAWCQQNAQCNGLLTEDPWLQDVHYTI